MRGSYFSHRETLMAACIMALVGVGPVWGQSYFVTHIAPLSNESTSSARAMNNYGHIVGVWTATGSSALQGYYYDGVKYDLGVGVEPQAISDNGWVTGLLASGEAFVYDHATGMIEPLGTLGGPTSVGVGVNAFGEVAGESQMPNPTPNRAFLYRDGVMTDLGVPSNVGGLAPDYTKANGLNGSGLVVGEALVRSGGEAWAVPFFYDAADPKPTMLKLSGVYSSGSAWALNAVGHIVGWASTNIETWGRGFLHDGATMTNLGTIPGKAYTIATSVNNLDEVVGYGFGEWIFLPCCGNVWTNNIRRAFIWQNGTIVNLNTLKPTDVEGDLTIPVAINDSGKILVSLGSETVVMSPIITADGDDDGDIDLGDFASFADCYGGPGADPDPTPPMIPPTCIRLFDFDQDYDVDMSDFARLQVKISQPGIVSGMVEYTGFDQGTVFVTASEVSGDGFAYETAITGPGTFEIEVWRTGDYDVSAFLDANGNGILDAGEPFAPSLGNPFHTVGEGGFVADVLVDLGPYAVAGSVAYTDGTPVSDVTILVAGPTPDETVTDADGTFAVADLLGGDYVVTASDAALYFYPFDGAFPLIGGDAAGVDFEAHDFPTGEVDGEAMGLVSAVDPANFSITIDEEGVLTIVYVYADTTFSGAATSIGEVTVGHMIEAQFYSSVNLAAQIDTDPS